MRWLAWRPSSADSSGAEKRPPSRRVVWITRGLLALSAVTVSSGAAYWLYQSNLTSVTTGWVISKATHSLGHLGFRVEKVTLAGKRNQSIESIRKATNITLGDPILGVPIESIRKRLEDLPWIRLASVERLLPSSINIRIVEHQPMALWKQSGRTVLIGTRGQVIKLRSLARYSDLPVLVGAGAPEHGEALLSILSTEPELKNQVIQAVRIGERRWNIHLSSNIRILLPETGALLAWRRLATEMKRGLLGHNPPQIDLRVPGLTITGDRSASVPPAPAPKLRRRAKKI